jgi:hypothetical protein
MVITPRDGKWSTPLDKPPTTSPNLMGTGMADRRHWLSRVHLQHRRNLFTLQHMSDFISQAALRSSIYNISSNGHFWPSLRAK